MEIFKGAYKGCTREIFNSNIIPYLDCGLYHSGYEERIKKRSQNRFKSIWTREAAKLYSEYLLTIPYIYALERPTLDSPEYYNYSNEEFSFILLMDKEKLIHYISKEIENDYKFFDWISETYKSYDGFICNMPNSEEKFYADLNSGGWKAIAEYLTCIYYGFRDGLQKKFIASVEKNIDQEELEYAHRV